MKILEYLQLFKFRIKEGRFVKIVVCRYIKLVYPPLINGLTIALIPYCLYLLFVALVMTGEVWDNKIIAFACNNQQE